jgi:CheY-like chemotaxis protein
VFRDNLQVRGKKTMREDRKKLRVLVVDDEPLTRKLVCGMLKCLGHESIAAKDAEEALDCLLTDITMPGMDGWELAIRVKATHPCMPVVAITGDDPGSIVPRLNGIGIGHALFKPFNLVCLQDALVTTSKTDAAIRTHPGK